MSRAPTLACASCLTLLGLACGDEVTASSASTTSTTTSESGSESGEESGSGDFVHEFEARGFIAQIGTTTSFLVEDCKGLDQCFGNNPTSPYLLFNLPSYPEKSETLPPSSGPLGEIPKVPDREAPAYYLAHNEAIVIVGQTPPPARYFGITPYLFQRSDAMDQRVTAFASLGDTLNHVNARTDTGDPFDAQLAVVISADTTSMARARSAVEAAGVPSEAINELVLPSEDLRLGLTPDHDDTLMLLGRVALIEDPAAATAYLDAPPLAVYRLSPSVSGEPLPTPPRTPPGDGTDEDALEPALDALEAAIASSLADAGLPYQTLPVTSAALIATLIDPELCIATPSECLGDNPDTTYAAGPLAVAMGQDELLLGPDAHIIALGVNHEAAGKASYSNMGVYTQGTRVGVAAVTSSQMLGSASAYLPDHDDVDKLWAWEIRRDCGPRPHCLSLPTTFPGVALDASFFFIFRAYIQPGLSVSPAPDELLPERLILVGG